MSKKAIQFSSVSTLVNIPRLLNDIDNQIYSLLYSHSGLSDLDISVEDKSLLYSYIHSLVVLKIYSKSIKSSTELLNVITKTHPEILELFNCNFSTFSL